MIMKTIVMPTGVNWSLMFQRPQQLATAMARHGNEVHFVSQNTDKTGATDVNKRVQIEKNLYLEPVNGNLHDIEPFTLYVTYPPNIIFKDMYDIEETIFDSMDEPVGVFDFWNNNNGYNRAINEADLVLASSQKLYDKASQARDDVLLVPNAVDPNVFKPTGIQRQPEEIAEHGRIIGYVGSVASWVDQKLIQRVAEEYPDDTIVLVGTEMDDEYGIDAPNVQWIRHVPHFILPGIIEQMDVCLIPFDTENPVCEATNPIKLWEYLAMGKPIVSTAIPETNVKGVYWSETDDEFIENISHAFQEDPGNAIPRRRLAMRNTWEKRVKRIEEALDELCRK